MNAPIKHADLSPQDPYQEIADTIFDSWALDVARSPRYQRVEMEFELEREILSNGRVREEFRAEVLEGYRLGKFSSAQCCELYDKYLLWPARTEFFGVFYEGIRSFNAREDASSRVVSEDGSW